MADPVTLQLIVLAGTSFTALIGIVTAIIGAVGNKRTRDMHILINSRMTELLQATREGAHSAGMIQAREDDAREAKRKGEMG